MFREADERYMSPLPRLVPVAVFLTLLFAVASDARAEDTLILHNGREIKGTVLEADEDHVKLGIGGGSITYPRSIVKEIVRGEASSDGSSTGAPTPAAEPAEPAREEHALLYIDGKRGGTRVFRALERVGGFQFEERVTFLDAEGKPALEVFTVERCDADFLPTLLQVQESAPGGDTSLLRVEVLGERASVETKKKGKTETTMIAMPKEARFPLAAREFFLRESAALSGVFAAMAYDSRSRRFELVRYTEGGEKTVEIEKNSVRVRVVKRKRGGREEVEWIGPDLAAHMSELNGPSLRAMAAQPGVLEAVRGGDQDRVTGPDSAARTRYADPVAGFAIGKPDPSWTFEEPAIPGAAALVTVRSRPLGASVDVMREEAPPSGVTVERAAESLQRLLRLHSKDFRVRRDGYEDVEGARRYWMEATATTKGENTRTLAHLYVRDGRVFRLLAACPAAAFEVVRPEFEKILATFEFLARE